VLSSSFVSSLNTGRFEDLRGQELDLAPVRPLLERIAARWQPREIWLFGSRARGEARPDSDWDLLVVVPDGTPASELDPLVGWKLRKELRIPADVIPTPASSFDEYRSVVNTLEYEAAHFGLRLPAWALSY
jgi:uncharacterized protein